MFLPQKNQWIISLLATFAQIFGLKRTKTLIQVYFDAESDTVRIKVCVDGVCDDVYVRLIPERNRSLSQARRQMHLKTAPPYRQF